MSKDINTVLIIGATSGLGEAFAKHFHSQGKNVIAAGRRISRLNALKSSHSGLETVKLDVEDIPNIDANINAILKQYPEIDTVIAMAGIMRMRDFKKPETTETKDIASEITTNLTATIAIAHTVIPHFLKIDKPTTFMTVSSGLGFIPNALWPVYCATKAGIHAFTCSLRAELESKNVRVLELAPPYVATDLDATFKEDMVEAMGGPGKTRPPMPLEEYMASAIAEFEKEGVKEVAVGFASMAVGAWRGAFSPILESMGNSG
ncbi:hypothetical protein BGZ60DRAFT_475947 [Tricladium varicosporioides]|nr:hypothetical protein BGZ60DRAFT_475947 [Hymenoscyphus varicosporioides]